MRIGFILSLIFGVFIAIFALQNAATVSINFLFGNIEMSQALVILISAIIGALIVMLLGIYREISMKLKLRQLNKKVAQLEQENLNYKNQIEELTKVSEVENSYEQNIVDQSSSDNSQINLEENKIELNKLNKNEEI